MRRKEREVTARGEIEEILRGSIDEAFLTLE